MAENKRGAEDGKKDDDQKCPFTGKDIKRFDAAYTCSNEECKKQNNGKPFDYESNTYVRELQRKCPKCGTMNERHSGK